MSTDRTPQSGSGEGDFRIGGGVFGGGNQATAVAVGITGEGERRMLDVDVGPSEDRSFWTAFSGAS